ncbi:AI-2E family transporter [Streptomyces sp. UNOC14_S4]|uniref:AI-2E family transporter n=1 Tax=Streptomyces sp. UNOC14_S4 TaxID=2872340 RepID=UPI001E44AB00|nr:AI-2E family transporter [Streptomyces sp. UNOC14_S4]MCC3772521.1 AI-2E family transporter [Streptomyces sp. UNOC14_S4]
MQSESGPRTPRVLVRPTASWFAAGFGAGLGLTLAYLAVQTVLRISGVLTLLLLALFVAISLEPVVAWLARRRMGRGWAVTVVILVSLALLAGFLALVIPPVSDEISALVAAVPKWLEQLHDHHSTLGRLEDRFHLVSKVRQQLGSGLGSTLVGGLLGAGHLVISAVVGTGLVVVLTVYFMVGMEQLKHFCYRFVPRARRDGVIVLTEETLVRVGRYMLGNAVTSAIAGLATFAWCAVLDVPYAAALGVLVALLDMVPVVGSTIGGVVVSLVALAVSFPVALGTAGFYTAFRLAEDYLIMPKAMRFAVDVHPLVTVVAVVIGGALLGIVGALIAIPVAVAINIVLEETVFPRIDSA